MMTLTISLSKPLPPDPNPGVHLKIMPMDEMIELQSCDTPGELPVKHVFADKRAGWGYDQIKESILERGFIEGLAPSVKNGRVEDGHHRITVLYDLGARWCPYQWEETHGRWDYLYTPGA
jgi:hypothetical protein